MERRGKSSSENIPQLQVPKKDNDSKREAVGRRKIKLQFEARKEDLKKLDEEIGLDLGLHRNEHYALILNFALAYLKTAVNERNKGRVIVSLDKERGTYKKLHPNVRLSEEG